MPPRIHNLPKLMVVANLYPDKERMQFLSELSLYYLQSRYPGEIEVPVIEENSEKAEAIVKKTEDIVKWLFSMLK